MLFGICCCIIGIEQQLFDLLNRNGISVPEKGSDGAQERRRYFVAAATKTIETISNAFRLTSTSISNLGDLDGRIFFSYHIPMNGSCGFECLVRHHNTIYSGSPPKTCQELRELVVHHWDAEAQFVQVLQLNEHAGRKHEVAIKKTEVERTASDR
jgi:hypothetical protein